MATAKEKELEGVDCDWLLNHFTKERTRHFRRALARWHKWETSGFFEGVREVLEDAQAAAQETKAGASAAS